MDIVICCGGGAKVFGPATAAEVVVLGAGGSRGAEDAGIVGNGAVVARAGTVDAGTCCSSVCTAGGGYSFAGRSTAG